LPLRAFALNSSFIPYPLSFSPFLVQYGCCKARSNGA
jgi:hypothetical protein